MTRDSRYPPEWHSGAIQREIYERAGYICEHCGAVFPEGSTVSKVDFVAGGARPLILTVHHLDGNPANVEYSNLVALCQTCHLHVQAVWRPGWTLPAHWPEPPAWIALRGLAWRPNGQLTLWGEL